MRARYYEPGSGRFVSEDPSMKSKNWYAYCENNPVLGADYSGRETIDPSAALEVCLKFLKQQGIDVSSPWFRSAEFVSFILTATFQVSAELGLAAFCFDSAAALASLSAVFATNGITMFAAPGVGLLAACVGLVGLASAAMVGVSLYNMLLSIYNFEAEGAGD